LVPQPSAVTISAWAQVHGLLRTVAVADDRLQPTAILRRDRNFDPCSHVQSMNLFGWSGDPLNGAIY
jgi:hypothetical protein